MMPGLHTISDTTEYNNPNELVNVEGLLEIEATSFPHRETNIAIILLLQIPPQFHGHFAVRIVETNTVIFEVVFDGINQASIWPVLKIEETHLDFPRPGKYTLELTLDGLNYHSTPLKVKQG